jgi:hypothetical protein
MSCGSCGYAYFGRWTLAGAPGSSTPHTAAPNYPACINSPRFTRVWIKGHVLTGTPSSKSTITAVVGRGRLAEVAHADKPAR